LLKGKLIMGVFMFSLILLVSSVVVTASIQSAVSGYVMPESVGTSMSANGIKVEIVGTSLEAVSDENGYFSIDNVDQNIDGYVLRFSKKGYLSREIREVKVNGDIRISSNVSPVQIWSGDINNDAAINMADVMILALSFSTLKGDGKYNEDCDLNKDLAVNMADVMIISRRFNENSSSYPKFVINVLPDAVSITKTEDSKTTYSGLTSVSYGGYLNCESFQQDGIVSFNGYQYTAFWNTNKHVVMCRRKLPNGEWAKFEFNDHNLTAVDAHNTISIGICPEDGTIHLAFDHHGNDLYYRVSVEGLATNPEDITWAASSFGSVKSNLVDNSKITLVTYPRFITSPSKKMLFEYRYGTSGSGDQYLLEYDGKTHKWISLGKYIDGISQNNNAYAHGITYDKTGRLHETWCWRETPDASTNHDILYIYSDDNGRTWKNNEGITVSVTGSTFINSNTQGIKVWTIGQNRGLINQEAQAVDSKGQVHVLLSHMPDSQADITNFTNARTKSVYFHYWRDTKGIWHKTMMGFPVVENFRGKLAFSESDNLYAILPNLRIAAASVATEWYDWKIVYNDESRFFSDPLIDSARLNIEPNTLTVLCPRPSSPDIYNLTFTIK